MPCSARILADSVSPGGARLTSVEAVFPSILLREVNTHRNTSKNAASSRAIPIEKLIERVLDDPFVPREFGSNQPGMQAGPPLVGDEHEAAVAAWLSARDAAVDHARRLLSLGVHKQLANRLLETFSWTTAIWSATDWSNMFALRAHADAQPEFQEIATLVRDALSASTPRALGLGEWHLPLVNEEERAELDIDTLVKISVGRAARVSYLTHHGIRDIEADLVLYRRLVSGGHLSPLEHVATPLEDPTERLGNFVGWRQLRKLLPNEHDFGLLVPGADIAL